MRRYDPNLPLIGKAWLTLSEMDRIRLVERFHKKHGEYGESLRLHATIHVIVETQLAEQIGAVEAACARLEAEGLTRHEAIHAIGSVLADHIWGGCREAKSGTDSYEQYFARLADLTKDSWHEQYGSDA